MRKNIHQLALPLNYKDALRQIRNYLAGQFVGATRDEVLLEEVIKLMLCKFYLKKHKKELKFYESDLDIVQQYRKTFTILKTLIPSIFQPQDKLLLDPGSLKYIDETL